MATISRRSLLLGSLAAGGCARPSAGPSATLEHTDSSKKRLKKAIERLKPLQMAMPRPGSGDWLASHPEDGQPFEQFVDGQAILPTAQRTTLVVQPLGELSDDQRQVLSLVTRYLEAFFGLATRMAPALTPDIPPEARRDGDEFGEQWLTGHLLTRVLAPRLPADAVAYLAFTARDLWPGAGWNFVFGQASPDDRTGVWSLIRNEAPGATATSRRGLIRAMKIASHEAGHMFGMRHCVTNLCNMAGVNNLTESDAHPTWLCAKCLAKLSWATKKPPEAHLSRMLALATDLGMPQEKLLYEGSLVLLTQE